MARILLIEDEPLLARAVQRGLQEEHHQVEVLGDGTAGLHAALLGQHDLLILDLLLPGTPGLTLCRKLRAADLAFPILMLTARDGPADVVLGLDAGADDYLTKPFPFEVLLARVRTLLRRTSGPRLRFGPLEVDTAAHRVWRDGEEVSLTGREFKILETLLRRPGAVVSKQRIADLVWDNDPEPNTIEVYIASLRRKIDRGRSPLLKTIRGVGYVLRSAEGC